MLFMIDTQRKYRVTPFCRCSHLQQVSRWSSSDSSPAEQGNVTVFLPERSVYGGVSLPKGLLHSKMTAVGSGLNQEAFVSTLY